VTVPQRPQPGVSHPGAHLLQRRVIVVAPLGLAPERARITAAVAQSKTILVELFGVGPVLAAKLLGEVGEVRRFPTKHHFAAPPTPVPRRWRPPAARWFAIGCHGLVIASSTTPCI
jgi:hypothetical protein